MPFISSLSQVIEGNIDFQANIRSVTRAYDITTFQAFSFLWPFAGSTPADVRVLSAKKGTAQTPTILLAAWSYDQTTKSISISRLTEVGATSVAELSGRYQFTIRATV